MGYFTSNRLSRSVSLVIADLLCYFSSVLLPCPLSPYMKTDPPLHRLIVKFPAELLDSTDEAGLAKGKNKITGTLEAIIPIFVSLPFEIFKQAFQAKSFPIHDDIDRVSPLVSLVPSSKHQDTLAGTCHDTLAD